MRTSRRARLLALGLAASTLFAACGEEGSSDESTGSETEQGGGSGSASSPGEGEGDGESIASSLTLGGPEECPDRPLCLQGLEEVYGLEFAGFTPLDAGGPLTVEALDGGDIQVALLFTTDPQIVAKGWVLLEDDMVLQPSDNITPVVREDVLAEHGDGMAEVLDAISAEIDTEVLTALNKQVVVDQEDPADVAAAWLEDSGLLPEEDPGDHPGDPITVGSADFYESEILAEIYAQALEANGYPVETKLKIGSREIYFPALESGEVDLLPEYAGTLLVFLDPDATPSTEGEENADLLAAALEGKGIVALASSSAENKNGFVVTAETAEELGLSTISDLGKPLPE
jgi:osmoprotectant transport system substrate-binding protein